MELLREQGSPDCDRALDRHWLGLFLLHICELRVYIRYQNILLYYLGMYNKLMVYFPYTAEEIQVGRVVWSAVHW